MKIFGFAHGGNEGCKSVRKQRENGPIRIFRVYLVCMNVRIPSCGPRQHGVARHLIGFPRPLHPLNVRLKSACTLCSFCDPSFSTGVPCRCEPSTRMVTFGDEKHKGAVMAEMLFARGSRSERAADHHDTRVAVFMQKLYLQTSSYFY